jgi:hypothetical protein
MNQNYSQFKLRLGFLLFLLSTITWIGVSSTDIHILAKGYLIAIILHTGVTALYMWFYFLRGHRINKGNR